MLAFYWFIATLKIVKNTNSVQFSLSSSSKLSLRILLNSIIKGIVENVAAQLCINPGY